MRHTSFRFSLDPTPKQVALLTRHAGAYRFAYNQCLRLLTESLEARRTDPRARLPWSGFDFINALNAWKRSEAAGRIFVVSPDGTIAKHVTGLAWRCEVSAQVFEEAAIDIGRALSAYAHARKGEGRVGFPRSKRKGRCRQSFRLRNKSNTIRIGSGHPRSVTLPKIGTIRVNDDTRWLRRLLHPVEGIDPSSGQLVVAPRCKVLVATVSRHGDRWYISLNVLAPDLHPKRRHALRSDHDHGGWVGIDRGLTVFAVAATADGAAAGCYHAPAPLQRSLAGLQQRSRALSRARPRSRNQAKAIRRLSRFHARIANVRRSFLHEVSSQLVKTHDRLCLEDLTVANLIRNKHLARAITDASWAEFARQLADKQAWRGGQVMIADRWFPSTKTCSRCGRVKDQMRLAERLFRCDGCGLVMDRDHNAAANLAAWAEAASRAVAQAPDRQAGGRVSNASGGEGVSHRRGYGGANPGEGGTDVHVLGT
jgi:putative transposase